MSRKDVLNLVDAQVSYGCVWNRFKVCNMLKRQALLT